MEFPILLGPDGVAQRVYRVSGTPTAFIIDRRGYFLGGAIGPRPWGANAAAKLFTNLLREPSAAAE